jgi:hypothetical protein
MTTRTSRANYAGQPQAEAAEVFVNQLQSDLSKDGVALDGASSQEFVSDALSRNDIVIPESAKGLFGELPKESHSGVVKAIFDGVEAYTRQHGVAPTGDLINSAIQQAYAVTDYGLKKLAPSQAVVFDAVTTEHHDQLSLQPNRAAIAIISALAEAIPFANYLPVDIGSNEARLIIAEHLAGTISGDYRVSNSLDGINAGGQYVYTSRTIELLFGANWTAQFRQANTVGAPFTPDAATAALQVMRGRTIVYVNGIPVGGEASATQGAATASALVGSVTISGTSYVLSGNVNTVTGAVTATFTPALPGGSKVFAEGFADLENAPSTIPQLSMSGTTFQLYAVPAKVVATQTIDSNTQFANEMGLDPQAELMIAARNQMANERFYNALYKMKRVGAGRPATFDFDWTNQKVQKIRAQIWFDFSALLGSESQKMANDTADHGITHLFVGKNVMAQMSGLGREIFEPSGITARPGIYRLGRLFGLYEVYYDPRVVTESGASAEILAIGRSNQVARCPIVLGDAVPPAVVTLGVTADMKKGFGFYARQFTSTNPHAQSAIGATLITISNLF